MDPNRNYWAGGPGGPPGMHHNRSSWSAINQQWEQRPPVPWMEGAYQPPPVPRMLGVPRTQHNMEQTPLRGGFAPISASGTPEGVHVQASGRGKHPAACASIANGHTAGAAMGGRGGAACVTVGPGSASATATSQPSGDSSSASDTRPLHPASADSRQARAGGESVEHSPLETTPVATATSTENSTSASISTVG
eukprot:CAMPEP_0181288352 /NCGR_PEP_ID=MMETSP1101-20121128/286_1 /TAXON_ID=46948 /ORGANISM="Rhodomonas abbreviata, Strain Caron Lab Isolate" /LENGTH=193 /DNA_ID=CAMNT_0023392467 /DNA_START=312 /DNA_END=889 /DNA_ORIENTATION=-